MCGDEEKNSAPKGAKQPVIYQRCDRKLRVRILQKSEKKLLQAFDMVDGYRTASSSSYESKRKRRRWLLDRERNKWRTPLFCGCNFLICICVAPLLVRNRVWTTPGNTATLLNSRAQWWTASRRVHTCIIKIIFMSTLTCVCPHWMKRRRKKKHPGGHKLPIQRSQEGPLIGALMI